MLHRYACLATMVIFNDYAAIGLDQGHCVNIRIMVIALCTKIKLDN